MIVALDGPAGVGKSTIASILAEKAGFFYLNSGNFYRAVTLSVLENGVDPGSEAGVVANAEKDRIEIVNGRLYLNGRDSDSRLHNDRVEQWVAQHSAIIKVRSIVTELLREAAAGTDVVAEGRDISTVVFPDAELKVYLDASIKVRARRRYEQGTSSQSLEELEESIRRRDEIDINKPVGGLKIAKEAYYLDTSDLTIDEVCEKVLDKIKERK